MYPLVCILLFAVYLIGLIMSVFGAIAITFLAAGVMALVSIGLENWFGVSSKYIMLPAQVLCGIILLTTLIGFLFVGNLPEMFCEDTVGELWFIVGLPKWVVPVVLLGAIALVVMILIMCFDGFGSSEDSC